MEHSARDDARDVIVMSGSAFQIEPGFDAPLEALSHALAERPDVHERVLFMRARDGVAMGRFARSNWLHEQTFKPAADALGHRGLRTGTPGTDERFPLVLILPPRQRDETRALFARALDHVADDGTIMVAVANDEGARSGESDLARLCGPIRNLSKHKCRVFWIDRDRAIIDDALRTQWRMADAIQPIADGRLVSRPGLFAWDRIDSASALLTAHLPTTLAGRVADLGAGYGYISHHLLTHAPGITAMHLYEAEARALEPARINMTGCGSDVPIEVIWHDVTRGLPHRYDVIVSNPPFHHQGRADQPDLGRAFIRAAADALTDIGEFWLVANRHLPYETTLAERFAQVRAVAGSNGFKVIHATGPKR